MHPSTKNDLIIRIGTILIDCGYVLSIIVWLLKTKFLDALLFSPTIFFNIHGDTAWGIHLVLYSIISFIVFFIVGFFIWKLNAKVFGGNKKQGYVNL